LMLCPWGRQVYWAPSSSSSFSSLSSTTTSFSSPALTREGDGFGGPARGTADGTKICWHWRKLGGFCSRGTRCRFLHPGDGTLRREDGGVDSHRGCNLDASPPPHSLRHNPVLSRQRREAWLKAYDRRKYT